MKERRKEDDLVKAPFLILAPGTTHTYTVVLLFFAIAESLILGMGFQTYNLLQSATEILVNTSVSNSIEKTVS